MELTYPVYLHFTEPVVEEETLKTKRGSALKRRRQASQRMSAGRKKRGVVYEDEPDDKAHQEKVANKVLVLPNIFNI